MGVAKKFSKAFTLIEMIVVVAMMALVIPAVFSIIFVILQQQAKVYRLQTVKKEGDLVLANMQTYMKNNARGIYTALDLSTEKCGINYTTIYSDPDGSNFFFKDRTNGYFTYQRSAAKLIFNNNGNFQDLTTDKVEIDSFTIQCERSSNFSPPTISVQLTLSYNTTSSRPEDNASLTYNSSIKLKNY